MKDLGITRQITYRKRNGFYLLERIEKKEGHVFFYLQNKKEESDSFFIEVQQGKKMYWNLQNYGKQKKQLRIGRFACFVGNEEDLKKIKKEIEEYLLLEKELI